MTHRFKTPDCKLTHGYHSTGGNISSVVVIFQFLSNTLFYVSFSFRFRPKLLLYVIQNHLHAVSLPTLSVTLAQVELNYITLFFVLSTLCPSQQYIYGVNPLQHRDLLISVFSSLGWGSFMITCFFFIINSFVVTSEKQYYHLKASTNRYESCIFC